MESLGIKVHVIKLNPVGQALGSAFKTLGRFPLEIGYYNHRKYYKTVRELIAKEKFDIGFSFFMRTAEYLKDSDFGTILMAEDCRTLYQYRSYTESRNLKQKIVRGWEYRKLKKYEPEIVNHFDITTLVTMEDIASMKKQNPNAEYRLLTNGTDINKFIPPDEEHKRKGILFAGKLDVWANVLMSEYIVNKILPEVKKEVPDAVLDIVGATPPASVLKLQSDSVKVHANVPDMVPYLQNAELFIHPHTGGSGIQNKLLEAFACACPVVTTSTGIQGIPATNGLDVLIGEAKEELIRHTINVLKDKTLAASLGGNARQMIVETHSWEAVFRQVDGILQELTDKK